MINSYVLPSIVRRGGTFFWCLAWGKEGNNFFFFVFLLQSKVIQIMCNLIILIHSFAMVSYTTNIHVVWFSDTLFIFSLHCPLECLSEKFEHSRVEIVLMI